MSHPSARPLDPPLRATLHAELREAAKDPALRPLLQREPHLLPRFARYCAWPQVLQENKSSGIGDMFSKPLSHFLIGPGPFKRMGIQLIVLWPSGVDVVDQLLAAVPRAAL
jgi:hypothetical protein